MRPASRSRRTDERPSAETGLHLVLTRQPGVGAVLHTHSVWGTLLSDIFASAGGFHVEGYEMLKGLTGVRTHEHREFVPIFDNTQDIAALGRRAGKAVARPDPYADLRLPDPPSRPLHLGPRRGPGRHGTSKFSSSSSRSSVAASASSRPRPISKHKRSVHGVHHHPRREPHDWTTPRRSPPSWRRSAFTTSAGRWRTASAPTPAPEAILAAYAPGDRPAQGRGRLRHGRRDQRHAGDAEPGGDAGQVPQGAHPLRGRGAFHPQGPRPVPHPPGVRAGLRHPGRGRRPHQRAQGDDALVRPVRRPRRSGRFACSRTRPAGRRTTSTGPAHVPLHAGLLGPGLRRRRGAPSAVRI